ncbi:P-type conjugative transfer protein TrbJ (plasmid) [Pseudomonas sp. KHPS1]|nr:P-type conjugative transfer protein TrbJ [Pseudomonas sp. KHPS1]UTH38980.1 P-type conjugative transfer protein TrbJ [Pseudomonas sp. KHPS1]
MKFLAAKTVLAAAIAIGAIQGAHAGIPVIDGGNLTQNILTAIESVAQTLKQAEEYAKQVEQYQTQLEQYENMLQNTAAPAAYIWDQANATINKLLHAQDMLEYYQNRAGSLDAYLEKYQDPAFYRSSPCFNGTGCTEAAKEAMEENQRSANEAQKVANAAMFKGINEQQTNLKADAAQLRTLQSQASSADGQMKAIQAGNQLASHQSNQLLQIRGLMIAQQNALLAQMQAEQNRQAIEIAADQYSAKGTTTVKKNPDTAWSVE